MRMSKLRMHTTNRPTVATTSANHYCMLCLLFVEFVAMTNVVTSVVAGCGRWTNIRYILCKYCTPNHKKLKHRVVSKV
jgi:membrane protein DedA with SNARE-associated domain